MALPNTIRQPLSAIILLPHPHSPTQPLLCPFLFSQVHHVVVLWRAAGASGMQKGRRRKVVRVKMEKKALSCRASSGRTRGEKGLPIICHKGSSSLQAHPAQEPFLTSFPTALQSPQPFILFCVPARAFHSTVLYLHSSPFFHTPPHHSSLVHMYECA